MICKSQIRHNRICPVREAKTTTEAYMTLPRKCSVRIFPLLDWLRRDRFQSKLGKMRTRLTPNTDTKNKKRLTLDKKTKNKKRLTLDITRYTTFDIYLWYNPVSKFNPWLNIRYMDFRFYGQILVTANCCNSQRINFINA